VHAIPIGVCVAIAGAYDPPSNYKKSATILNLTKKLGKTS
jgi:hypothetical protein